MGELMSNDSWERLVELFAQGLELPAEEREAFYRSSAGSDPVLRSELLSLHRARTRQTDALQPLRDRLLGGGETDEKVPYFVMPWFEGATLAKVAMQRRLGWREVLGFMAQAARGLGAAHEAGILHRDVKPSNLVLTAEEELKIVDFGIARAEYEDTLTSSRVRLGTIAYMSPEQIRGDPLDPRTDLWSLGVTTYELLASRRPFDAETPGRLLDQVIRADPPEVRAFRRDLPEAAADLVAELLTGERDDRPTKALHVAAEMEALISS